MNIKGLDLTPICHHEIVLRLSKNAPRFTRKSKTAVVVQFGLKLSPNDRDAQLVASPMSLVVWIRPKYPYVKVFVPTKLVVEKIR